MGFEPAGEGSMRDSSVWRCRGECDLRMNGDWPAHFNNPDSDVGLVALESLPAASECAGEGNRPGLRVGSAGGPPSCALTAARFVRPAASRTPRSKRPLIGNGLNERPVKHSCEASMERVAWLLRRGDPMVDRRSLIAGVGGVLLASPLASRAQPPGRLFRIGRLGIGSPENATAIIQATDEALREHAGWSRAAMLNWCLAGPAARSMRCQRWRPNWRRCRWT